MIWSRPGPEELVCQFGQSIRGSRFWCFAWFFVVGHAELNFMVWSHPGPGELVCQFGQSIQKSRFWCFAWFLWLVGVVGLVDFGTCERLKFVLLLKR